MFNRGSKLSSQHLLWIAIFILLLLWGLAAGLRYWSGSAETAAQGDRLWQVTLDIQAGSPASGIVVRVAIPGDTPFIHLIGENFNHPGWRLRFNTDSKWGVGRQVKLTSKDAMTRGFELEFTLQQLTEPPLQELSIRSKLTDSERERFLRSDALLALGHETIQKEVSQLADASNSNNELLTRIFKRSHDLLPKEDGRRSAPEILSSGRASPLERAYTMVALCRASHLPARIVTGLELDEKMEASLHHWVEVYINGRGWLSYDPLHEYQHDVPKNFLPIIKDRADLVELLPGGTVDVSYTITNADELLETRAGPGHGWQSIFYLTRLPLDVRNVLAHLLLLPLAVLLTTLFRELTGARSYGTFIPAIFALAMLQAEWRMASITLAVVVLFAVLGRSALPVKFRRQPRLTAVLVLVVLGVSSSVSLMDYFQLPHDGKVVLMPVVITAILVDMFYRALEKEGPVSAMMKLVWTIVQVLLCIPVMQFESLGHWLVAHPETHLLTLALSLSITNYHGKRLVDFPRFHWLNHLRPMLALSQGKEKEITP